MVKTAVPADKISTPSNSPNWSALLQQLLDG